MTEIVEECEPTTWQSRWRAAQAAGFSYFDYLTVVERHTPGVMLEVRARATSPDFSESITVVTALPGDQPRLESLVAVYPGADWHERESAEMFDVTFVGNDTAPLLRHETLGGAPLRKNLVLAARVLTPWPGAAEPDIAEDGRKVGNPSRRRQRPPGVPENWIQA
ncbi:MAG: NADH-quinone oxidoreductase subunit C [Candidatus Nanopelagicales bacterium]|nr:NADH-quinone oxidoreductase subunit C [Candidatus Nanopelagicales bacterium]